MGESQLGRLPGHCTADFCDTVTDVYDCGLASSIQKAATIGRNDPTTFAADGDRIIFAEISRKQAGHVLGTKL